MRRRALLRGGLLAAPASLLAAVAARSEAAKPEPTKEVWTSFYSGTRVWGYADKHSITPGESFNLMLSTGPETETVSAAIEISRIGYYAGADRQVVFRSDPEEITNQDVQMTACAVGAGWPTTYGEVDTSGWRSGYYAIDVIDQADGQRDLNVAYIVVTDADRSGDILVWLSTNTYQAYNKWGGASLYESAFAGDRAQMVSFDRPAEPSFFEYEYFLVQWLERMAAERGWKIGYATNFDMYREPQFADRYTLLISGCHNEYWSKEEFEQVHRRIFHDGKSTLFIGANSAYWQVRYADLDAPPMAPSRGRQLVCHKSNDDPIALRVSDRDRLMLTTMQFRDENRMPETMLAGIAYQSYFEPFSAKRYAYAVADTSLPFFEGTGYKVGDTTGDIVGYEWDNTDPDGDGKRLWDAERSLIPALDRERIKVLFTANPVDVDDTPGKAEAVYFVSPAGGKVFSTGSIRWAWGLGKPGFEQNSFKTFNDNLINHLLHG